MPIVEFRPTSPGRRFRTGFTFTEITKAKPEKALVEPNHKSGGRNNLGRITTRHRGGGHKRLYRIVDFKRDKDGVPATVAAIEYDPNRSARIALLSYADGERRYILSPNGLSVGQTLLAGEGAQDVDEVIHATQVENLWVLPCGPTPPNPAEMVGSQRIDPCSIVQSDTPRYRRTRRSSSRYARASRADGLS